MAVCISSLQQPSLVVTEEDGLEVIKEKEASPALSDIKYDEPKQQNIVIRSHEKCGCCHKVEKPRSTEITEVNEAARLEKLKLEGLLEEKERFLESREEEIRYEMALVLEREADSMKERFDFMLQNEQLRATYMLREAHRERQEKISALQRQLECKNLAALMYVMCTERRKCKMERLKLVEEYSHYIRTLQDILGDAQALILHLSRGYKTAARVDHEWREKMKKIITEFQLFVNNFAGGPDMNNQYFFDVPALLKTTAPVEDNPAEDPCEAEEEFEEEDDRVKEWWELIQGDCKPFVMFGDMAEFKPPQRREVLKIIKAAKTAPKKWKEYAFHNMFIKSECSNDDKIKDEYLKQFPHPPKWECQGMQTQESLDTQPDTIDHNRSASTDIRGNMGSILKIITATNTYSQSEPKTALLAARDSMEITSTTKLLHRIKKKESSEVETPRIVLEIGNRKASFLDDEEETASEHLELKKESNEIQEAEEDEDYTPSQMYLGSMHHDSLDVIPNHVPDQDHMIHHEKVCPVEECQRLQVDSFVRTLPPYMRASPFMHFEKTFDDYEPLSTEQFQILKERLEKKEKSEELPDQNSLEEWEHKIDGVGVQTSGSFFDSLPPCTCMDVNPTSQSSTIRVYKLEDLFPVKEKMDTINKDCLYESKIQFDRCNVIGETTSTSGKSVNEKEFRQRRLYEIKTILNKHPSLCDLFQANTKC